MNNKQWQKLKKIFGKALELEGEERENYIQETCRNDPELLKEVQSLLEAHENPGLLDQSLENVKRTALSGVDLQQIKGKQIGPYRIVDELGRGGMGSVFLAERADGQFDQKVALKVLRSGVTTENQLRRFMVERQILASLNHPNIATLLDGGVTDEGQLWFVMEYVEGMPIDRYCDAHRLSIYERLKLFTEVCNAVQFAHKKLFIHRDLKPSNILVKKDGTVKLLDFGIAKVLNPEHLEKDSLPITQTGLLPLTPAYASPEQIRGETVTTSSDIYQLGVVLYELLTGYQPYQVSGRTPSEIERIICEENPTRPSTAVTKIPTKRKQVDMTPDQVGTARQVDPVLLKKRLRGDLDTIILKAMHKEPDRRYESVEKLGTDIHHFLSGRPVTAHPDSQLYRAKKYVNRHRWGVAATFAIFISLIIGIGIALWQADRASQAAELAQTEAEKATRALAQSEQSLARAEALHSFLIDLFWAAEPNRPPDQLPSTEDLLELGAEQALDEELAQPAERLAMLNAIAEIYLRQTWTDEARPLLEEAINLGALHREEWPQDLAKSLQLKADMARQEGENLQSISLLMEAEEVIEDLPEHWDLFAEIRAFRSYAERLEGNYHEAIRLLEPLYEEIQLQEEPDLELKTNILNFLSGFYADVGRLGEADELRDRNIELIEQLEGKESLNYGINLTNSLHLKYNLGQFNQAENRAHEAIAVYNDIYEEPTGVLSVTYGALAATKLFSGRFEEALSTLETASVNWAQSLDIDFESWRVPEIYEGLMLAYMNRWQEARDKLLQNRDLFGEGHHTMYYSHPEGIFAEALCRTQHIREGESVLSGLDNEGDEFTVQNPVDQARILEARAHCHFESGNLDDALQDIEKSIVIMKYPGRAMERSGRKLLLAKILTEMGQTNEASRQIERAEQLFREIDLPDHPMLTNIESARQNLIVETQTH